MENSSSKIKPELDISLNFSGKLMDFQIPNRRYIKKAKSCGGDYLK